jgi:formylmethanofuran dehydrogenase subunit D
MDKLSLILISGRSTKQGVGISAGKDQPEYLEATQVIELNPLDMERSGLNDGVLVRVQSRYGRIDATCRRSDIPEGLAFMAFGSACNQLVGGETYASGMPDSKHFNVMIEPIPVKI